jgi:hypothetical protein
MSGETSRWILLPVEFEGIWYSPKYGGFHIYLRDRFNPELPPDRLQKDLEKYYPNLARIHREHDAAEPTWLSKEDFEKEFGKIEAIVVDEEMWNSDIYSGYYNSLFFFTEHYVVVLREYDGYEYFLKVPRDWRILISNEVEK